MTVLIFGYFSFKNKKILKYFFVILIASLFINIPQLIDMHQTNGKNIAAFFQGLKTKQKAESTAGWKYSSKYKLLDPREYLYHFGIRNIRQMFF